jgi:hypothetical protein
VTKKPVLPVVDVDQTFPLLTTDGATRSAGSSAPGNQTPTVEAAIRDVLGWRPRAQDTKAFTAALDASFQLSIVEGHVEARYVQRGYAIQADLGGVTGGQASLYTRAQAGHQQITKILDALTPLRPDHDPEDCEAYRVLIRDSVRQLVMELGTPGGPRVELVDSAFGVLSGYQPDGVGGHSTLVRTVLSSGSVDIDRRRGRTRTDDEDASTEVALAVPGGTADDVPGQLGALRDRFGLTDDNVNTVDEEKIRTAYVTLVDLVLDLQRSWDQQRVSFGSDVGRGFLGTELVLINRLLAAAAEQVEEVEAVLDSALVSAAERQTIILNSKTRLTLDGFLSWLRVFLTEDGPRIARDTGRDGLTTSFTPTLVALVQTLRQSLVRRLVPCGSPSCGGSADCHCGRRGAITYLPLGCCTPLPPGMYAARTRIAVSGLCGLLERLETAAARIGRFSGVVLLDVTVSRFSDLASPSSGGRLFDIAAGSFVRVEVRGLHLRPTYIPAFVVGDRGGRQFDDLILPVQGSASATVDSVSAVFDVTGADFLFDDDVELPAVFAAAEVPLALVDGETGRVVSAPPVLTWPTLRPSTDSTFAGGPMGWDELPSNQRWIPQEPGGERFDGPVDEDDCTEPCADEDEAETAELMAERHTTEELERIADERQAGAERARAALAGKRATADDTAPETDAPRRRRPPAKTTPAKTTRSRRR